MLTEPEFRALLDRLRRRSPWGPDDRRGALNYITPSSVLKATREVRVGQSVSMAAVVEHEVRPDNPDPCRHQMTRSGDQAPSEGLSFAMDRIAMNIHGDSDSHIDALCHVIYDGALYNGRAASSVTDVGATEMSIAAASDGIVGRGVLLDIPRVRDVFWFEPGDHVTADDVAAAEHGQDVRVGEGDLAFIRVGHRRRRTERGPWDAANARAGLHPSALEFLADRQIAALGSDGNNDTAPSVVAGVDFPVHVLAITGLGLHLLDYLEFATLAPLCAEMGRWSFLCVIAPLRMPTATGSPINPIAIF